MHIQIEEISKEFGTTAALSPVSLAIPSGALVALLGPSGSGKTTLLRILGGLEYPTSGRVIFDGQDATGLSVQDRRAGFVFQSYALFRHMTVFDNIAYGLKARPRANRPARAEIARRVMKLLDLIQLPDIGSRYPSQLSGGQRQRVALARALAIEPRMLLLDEPFGALDAKVRKELRQGLRDIHDTTGLTSVFVTHDQEEAMELADRVVVLNRGRIEQVGTPDEVYRQPASPFVFDFIGRGAQIAGQVQAGAFRAEGSDRWLPLPGDIRVQGRGVLSVRPHELRLVPAGQGLPGHVRQLRTLAGRTTLDVELSHAPLVVEVDIDNGEPSALPLRGAPVEIAPQRAICYPA